ncbi:amidohydrolase family protein [uncultured Mailhella sp.]|uniref:amidohydrolase family protein n=1 Tax=uncultured Mailhella sp. TaxID=1981031 RepID=UPI002616863C|nr:amidohydrolase family protein [uncultured Mailhella sp.]
MSIIDMRFRPATHETLQGILTNPLYQSFSASTHFDQRPARTLDEEVAMLRDLDVVHAVVTGRDIHSSVDTASTNPGMLESIQKYPDFFTGFYGIDPLLRMQALRAFRQAIREYGVRGASIDPAMSGVDVDSALYYPFYAACCEENVPVAITTGCSCGMPHVVIEHHAPWLIDRVAADFPELTVIVSHGGYPWIMEMIGVATRHENVYIDFSACAMLYNMEQYVQAANRQLMTKTVFSSAHPFDHIADTLKLYATLPFTDEAREHVMYVNAAKLLGL